MRLLAGEPPTPPQLGQCWSNLMLVSGTYLTMVRVERIDQRASPQITINTTSTYQNHQNHPYPHPTLTQAACGVWGTQRVFSPHPDPPTRRETSPDVSLHCARSEPRVYGRKGAGGAETCSSTDFKPCRTWKIVFLRPRRSELDGTGAETARNAHDIGLVDHPRLSGVEIWPCRAAAPQNHAKTPLYQKNGAILPLKNAFPSES